MQYQAAISTRTLLYNHIQKTWKILIEDIAGDHYWLNNIVKRFTHITAKELKNLLEQEINKI